MSVDGAEGKTKPVRAPHGLALWTGLLASPVAWLAQMQVTYSLALWVCYGVNQATLHAASTVGLVIAVSAGLLALRNWRTVGRHWPSASDPEVVARTRLLSALGLMNSLLFSLLIIAQWIAVVILQPCPA